MDIKFFFLSCIIILLNLTPTPCVVSLTSWPLSICFTSATSRDKLSPSISIYFALSKTSELQHEKQYPNYLVKKKIKIFNQRALALYKACGFSLGLACCAAPQTRESKNQTNSNKMAAVFEPRHRIRVIMMTYFS